MYKIWLASVVTIMIVYHLVIQSNTVNISSKKYASATNILRSDSGAKGENTDE
jgi:hypothetical protein